MKDKVKEAERMVRFWTRRLEQLQSVNGVNGINGVNAEKETEEKRDLPPTPPIERKEVKEKDSLSHARAWATGFFDEFWTAYPGQRKKDRRKCCKKYERILRDADDPMAMQAKILAGLERWKRCWDWIMEDGKFVCAPLVWLNNERWEAEILPAPKRRERSTFDASKPASYLKPTQAQIDKVKGLF